MAKLRFACAKSHAASDLSIVYDATLVFFYVTVEHGIHAQHCSENYDNYQKHRSGCGSSWLPS